MLCFFASSGYLKCQRALISTVPILRDKIICSIVALPVRPLYISFERKKDSRLILLYKGLKGKARIPTDDLVPKNRRCRNQHSLAFQIPSASKEAYKSSFFPQTIRDWNDLPDSLISSAEMSDDCVQN